MPRISKLPQYEGISEVIVLTQLVRELNLTFSLLVPPNISTVLFIIVSILILIPTLSIIILTVFSIPSGLLVTLLVP